MASHVATSSEQRIGIKRRFSAWLPFAGLAVVLPGVLLIYATHRPSLGICRMPDGSRLTLAAVTYGKRHRYDDRTALERALDWVRAPKTTPDQFATADETLVAWIRVTDRPKGNSAGFHLRQVKDSHGCSLGMPNPIAYHGGTGMRQSQRFSANLGHLPYDGGPLTLEFRDEIWSRGVITFDPRRVESRQPPIAKPLPQRAAAGDLAITLNGVQQDHVGGPFDESANALLGLEPLQGNERLWSAGWFALADSSGRRIEN